MEFKDLYSIRNLRQALEGQSVKKIDELIARINDVKQEHVEAEKEAMAQREKKLSGIKQIKSIINQFGLTQNDLEGLEPAGAATGREGKRVMKPRYRFTDENGLVHTWSGQGKTPTILRKIMERDGTKKEDYLIPEEEQQQA
jgi:DNA-binding protein H-NS